MWDLVGNPEDRFSHNEAQIMIHIEWLILSFIIVMFALAISMSPWSRSIGNKLYFLTSKVFI